MPMGAHRLRVSETALSAAALDRYAADWPLDCDNRQHSRCTLASRRAIIDKLLCFVACDRCRRKVPPICSAGTGRCRSGLSGTDGYPLALSWRSGIYGKPTNHG